MAFKLKEDNNFKATVNVVTPDEQGSEVKWQFTGVFRIVTDQDRKDAGGDIVKAMLVSAEDVPREDGMTDERVMEILCTRGDTRNAIMKTYNEQVVKKNQGSSLL
jgi:hypothetical protein